MHRGVLVLKPLTRILQGVEFQPNGCWKWTKGLRGEHPKFRAYGKQLYVHRYMLELRIKRSLVKGEQACHSCGFALCVNPDHLYVGNARTNGDDCKLFGKPKVHLSDFDRAELVKRYAAGEPALSLAKSYNITRKTVNRIIRTAK